jgi:DNA repair exonuclease SbcCD ATPase subunit
MVAIRFDVLEPKLAALRNRHSQAQGQRDLLVAQRREKEQQLTQARADIELWRQVQVLLGKASEFAREQLKQRIEQTVTAALAAIFNDSSMKFEIEMGNIGGRPAADWRVVSCYGVPAKAGDEDIMVNAYTVTASPEDAKGGGVTDVVSLALRLALLELSRPRPGGPMLFDEPGKMISREYLPNVAEFLKQYAAKTGRQIIMVTHHEVLADVADVGYVVKQDNGVSEVSRNV